MYPLLQYKSASIAERPCVPLVNAVGPLVSNLSSESIQCTHAMGLLPEHRAWCEWILRFYTQFIWGLSTVLGDKRASEFVLYCFPSQYIHATGILDLLSGRQNFYECFQVMES